MIRRVLVVQPFGIGDLLFTTPVLRALRLIPTVERVDMLIGSRTKAVIQSNPHVNGIYVIDKDQMHRNSFLGNVKFLGALGSELRKHDYDLMLDYSIRGEYAFWSRLALGIGRRAGYAYKNRGIFHNIRLPLFNGFEGKHVVDYVCDLAQRAGVPVKDRFVEFFFSKPEREALERGLTPKLPRDYFALSLGGGESWGKDAHLKRWSPQKFAELAKYLVSKTGIQKIALIGSAGEAGLAGEFLKSGIPAENLTGKLSLTETAWVLKKSRFFLGNDGGLLHLARAVFRPAIGVYGPADPKVYGPYPAGKDSVAVYKQPPDGKPRYFKFRYDPNDKSLEDLSVSEAIAMIETAGITF